jgi:hypothetical protein
MALSKWNCFLIDYAQMKRVKIWGEARAIEGDEAKLIPNGYKARPEQVILVTVTAWDRELSAAHSAALRCCRRCRCAR